MENSDFSADYWEYLKKACPNIAMDSLSHIASTLESTSWNDPTTAIDLNNFAVIALIEAEQCQNSSVREIYLEMAFEALNKGIDLYDHPLCAAHLALALTVTGEIDQAISLAFYTFDKALQAAYVRFEEIVPGIVYLPPSPRNTLHTQSEALLETLQAEDGYTQAFLLGKEAIERLEIESIGHSEIVIIKAVKSVQILKISIQIFINYILIYLSLGFFSLRRNNWRGLVYLNYALKPINYSGIFQIIFLRHRDLEEIELAKVWLEFARTSRRGCNPNNLEWRWTELEVDSPITYVPFETEFLLAVEPTSHSMVTSIVIGAGDWFESEMEFWRNQIQPGMTVIDVGANVGIYTFSAARRVGPEGRVLAIEPFSGCIRCLEETCRINQTSWVKVCAGAASDRNGTARLSLCSASELNQLISSDAEAEKEPGAFKEVACFSLDSLIWRENVKKVDFLKIDAEGHEMQVLAGSERILTEFAPTILYENSNPAVADFLQSRGYQLFIYQPYVQQLRPIDSTENWQTTLNLIAVPDKKTAHLSS